MGLKILLIALHSLVFIPANEPQTYRKLYTQVVFKKEKAEEMISILSAKPKTPLVTGYLGAVNMIMAKHAINPIRKLSFFRTGQTYMERSIEAKPADAELRLLRYTIQVSAPSFLGYHLNIQADKNFLLNSLRTGKTKDNELEQLITRILNQQDNTPADKQLLNRYL